MFVRFLIASSTVDLHENLVTHGMCELGRTCAIVRIRCQTFLVHEKQISPIFREKYASPNSTVQLLTYINILYLQKVQ